MFVFQQHLEWAAALYLAYCSVLSKYLCTKKHLRQRFSNIILWYTLHSIVRMLEINHEYYICLTISTEYTNDSKAIRLNLMYLW